MKKDIRCSECGKKIRGLIGRNGVKKNTKNEYLCKSCFWELMHTDKKLDFDIMISWYDYQMQLVENNYYRDDKGHVIGRNINPKSRREIVI